MTFEGTPGTGAGATPNQQPPATGTPGATPPGATPTTPPPATGNQQQPGQQVPSAGQQPGSGQEDLSTLPEGVQTLIKNLRRSEQTLKGKVDQFERANLSEIERRDKTIQDLTGERDTLRGELSDIKVGQKFAAAAAKAGAIDPDLLYQVAKAQVQLDDKGEPSNLEELIRGLKGSRPNQFRRGGIDGGAGGGQSGQPSDMNRLIRGMAGKSTG